MRKAQTEDILGCGQNQKPRWCDRDRLLLVMLAVQGMMTLPGPASY